MKLMLKWGLLAAVLTVFVGSTPAHALFGGPVGAPPGSKCAAGKFKCVIKKKACLLGCWKKALGKAPFVVDSACLGKCHDKFDGGIDPLKGCFAKLEAKGGCLTTDDTAVIEAKIDAHVLDIVAELNPLGVDATTGKCTAGKVGCILKYNSCILGNVSKAAGAGVAIDGAKVQKCRDGIVKCVDKLDVKGDTDLNGVSDPGCQTNDDEIALQAKDDAFVDDLIAELIAGQNDMNSQRCSANTSVKCTNAPGGSGGPCTGLGTCEFYFGSVLPLSSGGVATCVVSQWSGGISGTFNQQTGHSAGTANIISTVYNGISAGQPCPRCNNDVFPNDGTAAGTCAGGTRNGLACDANGQSPFASFGSTSHDCPPSGAPIATIPVNLDNSTGTITKTLAASGPNCPGTPGDECLCGVCSGNNAIPCFQTADCTPHAAGTCVAAGIGEPEKTNACADDTTIPGDGTNCAATGSGDGECPEGPFIQRCRIDSFRTCTVPTQGADCPAPGDSCGASGNRECFPGYNGVVGQSISVTGAASQPRNHAGTQTFGSVFCISATSQPAVNVVAGLPGPGRLALSGVGQENGTSGVCPTEASFLPTSRGGILDTGWTGIAHDATVISQGKVTVQVTGCASGPPNCGVCSYTGPIPNANAAP